MEPVISLEARVRVTLPADGRAVIRFIKLDPKEHIHKGSVVVPSVWKSENYGTLRIAKFYNFWLRIPTLKNARRYVNVGSEPTHAAIRYDQEVRRLAANIANKAAGLPMHVEEPEAKEHDLTRIISAWQQSNIDAVDAEQMSSETRRAYNRFTRDFLKYADQQGYRTLEDIVRACNKARETKSYENPINGHVKWLEGVLKSKTNLKFQTSVGNRLRGLNSFFNSYGHTLFDTKSKPGLLPRSMRPPGMNVSTTVHRVDADVAYEPEDVELLLHYSVFNDKRGKNGVVGGEDLKDLILFAVQTGFRKNELAHVQYSDIVKDAGNFAAQTKSKPKSELMPRGFYTKNRQSRSVEISRALAARIESRRKRHHAPFDALIFASKSGRPDFNLNERLSAIIKRIHANGEKLSAGSNGFHRLRKRYAVDLEDNFGLDDIRKRLGHSSVVTTERYLRSSKKPQHALMERTFRKYGD
jgi:integrase